MHKLILILFLCFIPKYALSCSLASGYQLFTIDTPQKDIKNKPHKPIIELSGVYRGYKGEPSMCADAGIIKLKILNPTNSTGYVFKVIEGRDIDKIFPDEIISPYEASGEIEFAWLDGAADKQEPLKFHIQVKAVSISGVESEASYFWIKDEGKL